MLTSFVLLACAQKEPEESEELKVDYVEPSPGEGVVFENAELRYEVLSMLALEEFEDDESRPTVEDLEELTELSINTYDHASLEGLQFAKNLIKLNFGWEEATDLRPLENLTNLEELVLNIEELEAIRLKDREGLEQVDCAERMHVSRATFQRILVSARSKLAEAIIEGKAIKIEGGNYHFEDKMCFKCAYCTHEFGKHIGTTLGREIRCPKCSLDTYSVSNDSPNEEE